MMMIDLSEAIGLLTQQLAGVQQEIRQRAAEAAQLRDQIAVSEATAQEVTSRREGLQDAIDLLRAEQERRAAA